jgi:hypothetical protein
MQAKQVLQALKQVGRRTYPLSPSRFSTSVNSQGQRSRIARRQVDTVLGLQAGRDHPMKLAIPAYESKTTDGTADNTETFSLSHSVVDTPDTQSVVVWLGGSYYGTPDAVDYANDTIDVTDSGTGSTVHIYYISDAAATLEFERVSSNGNVRDTFYTASVGRVHRRPQSEQPEYLSFPSDLHRFIGHDQKLDVYLDAPYTTRFTDPDGDETEPYNALLQVPTQQATSQVPGLPSVLKGTMGD